MSFVNLMASDVWSEADIVNRTEAMISGHASTQEVAILNRKVTAVNMGVYVLSEGEQAELQAYQAECLQAQQAGIEARRDMALLLEVLRIEAGELDPAQASYQAQALHALRNPVTDEEGDHAPVPV